MTGADDHKWKTSLPVWGHNTAIVLEWRRKMIKPVRKTVTG